MSRDANRRGPDDRAMLCYVMWEKQCKEMAMYLVGEAAAVWVRNNRRKCAIFGCVLVCVGVCRCVLVCVGVSWCVLV